MGAPSVHNATVSFGGGGDGGHIDPCAPLSQLIGGGGLDVGGVFVQYAEISGNGGSSATGAHNSESGAGSLNETVSADTSVSQSAFNQEIVMGANLQNNSITAVVGGGSQIGDDLDAA